MARPHGPLRPAARRADDLHLARLVRELQREGQRPAADARPEQPVPRTRARELPRPVPGGHHRPGDAGLPRRHLQRQARTERELRARDDGAVLARRRPRRLHRGRRPRNGPRADRLDGRMDRKQRACRTSASTPPATTAGNKTVFGQTGNWNWEDAVRLCVDAPAARLVLREQAVELLRPRAARRSDARLAAGALHLAPATASAPVVEAILQHPDFLERPRARHAAGRLQRRPAARDRPPDRHHRLGVAVLGRRAAAVLPAQRLRLGLHPLAGHLHRQGALGNRQLRDRRRPTRTRGRAKANRTTAKPRTAAEALASALAYWGSPRSRGESRAVHRRLRPDLPRRAWPPPNGSRAPTGRCARTRCGC